MKVFMQPGGVDRPDRMRARDVWTRWFRNVDVVICPAGVGPALPHDTRPFESRTIMVDGAARPYHDVFFWTSFAAFAGLPAAVAPIGFTTDGLPIAVQIIGPPYEDDTVLTFAELLAADGVIAESPHPASASSSFRRK
jgi:amidase